MTEVTEIRLSKQFTDLIQRPKLPIQSSKNFVEEKSEKFQEQDFFYNNEFPKNKKAKKKKEYHL